MKEIDKSKGEGCITCEMEKGKTCEGCSHRNDIAEKCRQAIKVKP